MAITELQSKDRGFWNSESALKPNNVKYGNSQFALGNQLEICRRWRPDQELSYVEKHA